MFQPYSSKRRRSQVQGYHFFVNLGRRPTPKNIETTLLDIRLLLRLYDPESLTWSNGKPYKNDRTKPPLSPSCRLLGSTSRKPACKPMKPTGWKRARRGFSAYASESDIHKYSIFNFQSSASGGSGIGHHPCQIVN